MAFNINTPVQERFTLPGGVRGEIGALGKSVRDALSFLGPIALADFVNPLAGVATANASIMLATASSMAPRQLYPGAAGAAAAAGSLRRVALDSLATGGARRLNFLTGGTAAQQYHTATIWGKDAYGKKIREVVTLALTAASVLSKNYWSAVRRIDLTGGTGAAATLAISMSNDAALPAPARVRGASAILVLADWLDGASAPGTIAVVAAVANVSPVYYSYTPSSAFDGARDFGVFYEFDPTA